MRNHKPLLATMDHGGSPARWLLTKRQDQLGITLPATREYHTVAGFVLAHLRHLPETGEAIEVSGWRLEVVDLDDRIDKVLASRLPLSQRML